jgi:hypothetical protein
MKAHMMGKIVTVRRIAVRKKIYGNPIKAICEYRDIDPRAGWVVGERIMYLGDIERSNWDHSGYLITRESKKHICVAFWPTMKPVLVREDDMIEGGEPISPAKAEWKGYEKNPELFKRLKAEYRAAVKNAERDSKGRFV